jgi:protein-disulfide isomerase
LTKTVNPPERSSGVSRRQILTIGAGVATAGLVATWIYSFRNPRQTAVAGPIKRTGRRLGPTELAKPGPLPELVLGKEDAPVTIIEYADLTCPACAAFHSTVLPQVKAKYIDTGKARLVFREFPTNTPSVIAFMTVRCVGPDKAHPLISALFSRQEEWRGAKSMDELRTKLFALGQQVGLTRQAFDSCVPSGGKTELTASQQKLLKDISTVRDRANEGFGVSQTPTFFVNGKKLAGAAIEDFDKAVGQVLTP